jgi:hypothetical protein
MGRHEWDNLLGRDRYVLRAAANISRIELSAGFSPRRPTRRGRDGPPSFRAGALLHQTPCLQILWGRIRQQKKTLTQLSSLNKRVVVKKPCDVHRPVLVVCDDPRHRV